jgi:hypothetical protein
MMNVIPLESRAVTKEKSNKERRAESNKQKWDKSLCV